MNNKKINCIKSALAAKGRTSKWLAEKMGKDRTTVSKWCTNTSQPPLETLVQIAQFLEMEPRELICIINDKTSDK